MDFFGSLPLYHWFYLDPRLVKLLEHLALFLLKTVTVRCSVSAWPVDDVLPGEVKEAVTVFGDVVVLLEH